MKHYFVINPAAGKGKAATMVEPQIREFMKAHPDFDCVIHVTKSKGEAIEYVREHASLGEPCRFYACGGDGTLFEVVNGAVGFGNAEVAAVPLGSGNDFIKLFGNTAQFTNINSQVQGTPVKLDLIKCGDVYAINQCSMGLDAEVCAKKDIFMKMPLFNGETSYVAAVFYCFFKKCGTRFNVKIDGDEEFSKKVLFAVAGNSRWYGGGFMPCPLAMPDDGELDFVVVEKRSNRFALLTLLGKYKKGLHLDWPITYYKRGKKMTVKSEELSAINVDGEVYYDRERTFEIVEKAVSFVIPSNASYFEDIASGRISGEKMLAQK